MLQMAAALDRNLFEPVAAFTQDGPILKFAQELGLPARVAPMPAAFFYSAAVPLTLRTIGTWVWYYRRTVEAARSLAERVRPDLVHLNTSGLVPTAVGVSQTGIPVVWHIRERVGQNPILRRWHIRRIQSLSDHIVANSSYVAQDYLGPKPVTVIHNALEKESFHPAGNGVRKRVRSEFSLPADAAVIGIIGAVQAAKGHYVLLDAARTVIQNVPGVRFLVVGGGVGESYERTFKGRAKRLLGLPLDHLERMQVLIQKHQLHRHFVFSGFRNDMARVIAAMDLLVFPSLVPEGFGRPLMEAMAIGCPIVASDIGATSEVVGKDAAVLVSPGHAEELAHAIVAVLRNREQAQKLGEAGRRRFLANFDMTTLQAKLQQVYEQVLRSD